MPWINTDQLTPDGRTSPGANARLTASENEQVYCGLDSMVTLEVFEELTKTFPALPATYSFERALQGPYMEVMRRGWLVDGLARRQAAQTLNAKATFLEARLQQIALAIWGKPLNPRSPDQLKAFFYGAMRLPEVWISQKGIRRISTNREALEKLELYVFARPAISCILAIRDIKKQLDVLEAEIDSDGRWRTSYNITGTETGRPSSSKNAYGTGGNAQNIASYLRFAFVADPGWKLCAIDLEQVEARDVGWFCGVLFGDWSYLDACEHGDLHVNTARMTWREMPWTGEAKADRELADQLYYREFTFRDATKRLGHLTNYRGTAWTASRVLKIPVKLVEDFQWRYALGPEAAYPCIPRFWQWVAQELQTRHFLTTPFGRKRWFFGRPEDDATIREGVANLPQSTTADRTNLGFWRIWHHMPQVQLLGQGYDSVIFQYRESADAEAIIGEALSHMRVELTEPGGRRYVVPAEAKVGWNWGSEHTHTDKCHASAKRRGLPGCPLRVNADGLMKWTRGKPDTRARHTGLQRSAQIGGE